MATLYKIDGTQKTVTPAAGANAAFTLKEMQTLVGGLIELVYLDPNGDRALVVNEEGKVDDLPFNQLATDLATEAHALIFGDVIVGDAVLVTNAEMGE